MKSEALSASDSGDIEKLRHSFDEFLACFMGREQLADIRSGKDKIYMPLSPDMLGTANVNLRYLLCRLAFLMKGIWNPHVCGKKSMNICMGILRVSMVSSAGSAAAKRTERTIQRGCSYVSHTA